MKNNVTGLLNVYGIVALLLLAVVVALQELWARAVAAALYLMWIILMGSLVQDQTK